MYTPEQIREILSRSSRATVDPYAYIYIDTEHPCPECGQGLRREVDSTMLVCSNKDHGPYFLV